MNSKTRRIAFTLMILCWATYGNAELIDRGGGFLYDPLHNITWFKFSYYGWNSSCGQQYVTANFIHEFEIYDPIRGVTWTDWRLPSALNSDGTGPDVDGGDSEMATLFTDYGINIFSPGPFIGIGRECNLNNAAYWTSTEGGSAAYSWAFSFWTGTQGMWDDGYWLDALIVRGGDVGTHDRPPVANAGMEQIENVGVSVMLDGSQSSDEDGNIVAFHWTLVHRENQAYNQDAEDVTPTFSQLEAGIYDVSLSVTDDDDLMGVDTMVLAVVYGQAPAIKSILDVKNDDGRQVRVSWYRSEYDTLLSSPLVTEYGVYRRIDQRKIFYPNDEFRNFVPLSSMFEKLAGWDFIEVVPARGDDVYEWVAPTLCDSTVPNGMCWSAFLVSAMTSNPQLFFDSPPDSGYSLDNLAPPTSQSFEVLYAATGNNLIWEPVEEKSVVAYRVYRSDNGGPFVIVKQTDQTSWLDDQGGDFNSLYQLRTLDAGGNESDPLAPDTITSTQQGPPQAFLGQNVPNPFNPLTRIEYRLSENGVVHLAVFDVSGRLVRTLVAREYQDVGVRVAIWDGCDEFDHKVASGTYFYRLEAGEFRETKRMVLIK